MNQQSLPYQMHSPTSRAAAESMKLIAGTQRHAVYSWLYDNGPATDEQIQEGTGLSASSQRPRRVELQRMGLVIDSGKKARTKSGRQAVLWEVR